MPIETTGRNLQLNVPEMFQVLGALPHTDAVFCEGKHGIGKSSIFRQLAESRNAIFIDMRLSQVEYVEIAGYPDKDDGRMVHLNPWWRSQIERAAKDGKNVVLLFDELNRAHKDVLQTVFQVVLDREVQGWKMPSNIKVWIYAAGNIGGDYEVTDLDPALVDRFFRFELTPTVEDWLTWAKGDGDVHKAVTAFISKNNNLLDPPSNLDDTGEKMQSRRSWAKFSEALKSHPEFVKSENTRMLQLLAAGYLGTKVAPKLAQFVREEFQQLTAYDVLDHFDKKRAMIEEKCGDTADGAATSSVLLEAIIEVLSKEDLTDKRKKNYLAFLKIVPMDVVLLGWKGLLNQDSKLLGLVSWLSKDEEFRKRITTATANNL